MWPKFRSSSDSVREVIITSVKIWPWKPIFLRGALGSSSIILELPLGMALKFYSSVAKLKAKTFRGLIPTVAEVTLEKLVWGSFFGPIPILNRIKLPTFSCTSLIFHHNIKLTWCVSSQIRYFCIIWGNTWN